MKKHIKILCSSLTLIHIVGTAHAQEVETLHPLKPISYSDYIHLVGENNAAYSAEKLNIPLAEASALSAAVFPDPELAVGYFDNGERRLQMGYGFSSQLSWKLELGGKRKARKKVAHDQKEMTTFALESYFKTLRAEATVAYLESIRNRHLLNVRQNTYQQLKKLAESDRIRFKLGSISELDARKSTLEAATRLNDVYAAQAAWEVSLAALSLLLGEDQTDTLWYPREDLKIFERTFDLSLLILSGQQRRADLQAARQHQNVSSSELQLAKVNRVVDLELSVGAAYNSYAANSMAPTPSFTTINVGIAIPLKFSNRHAGDLKIAQYTQQQVQRQYEHMEHVIQIEITQAYYHYEAMRKQVAQYHTGLLKEAEAILNGQIYSYQRGETSFLAVLDAQRTYNDVQHNYYETLYNQAIALVALEQAAGIWGNYL